MPRQPQPPRPVDAPEPQGGRVRSFQDAYGNPSEFVRWARENDRSSSPKLDYCRYGINIGTFSRSDHLQPVECAGAGGHAAAEVKEILGQYGYAMNPRCE